MRTHPKWLSPMPSYYADWSYRDDPRICFDLDFTPNPNLPEPRRCQICQLWYQPRTRAGHPPKYCRSEACSHEAMLRRKAKYRARKAGAA